MHGPAGLAQTATPTGPTGGTDPLARPAWLPEAISTGVYRLVVAVAVVVLAYYVSKATRQLLGRRIARRFTRPSVSRTVLRGIQAVVVLVGVMVGLGFLGLGFGNLALSVGVFSAVVGIVLAPIIGNVLSGVFILNEQPYEIGDMVELSDVGTTGFVEDITLLYTKVFTLDNTFLVLPNGSMRDRDVVNYSAEDTRIRMTLDVGVTYESDLQTAREQMEAGARAVEAVIQGGPAIRIGSARYPAAPTCYIREFGDSEVLLGLRYWATEPYRQTAVRSRVLTNVWRRFDDHDIEIPYPHRHLVVDDTSGEMSVAMRDRIEGPRTRRGGATQHDDPESSGDDPGKPATGRDAHADSRVPDDEGGPGEDSADGESGSTGASDADGD
jgi:small-conductance mechanosensitive channel